MSANNLVHLHVHTHYSLDAFGSPKAFVQRAKALGMDAIAITDRNGMYGVIEAVEEGQRIGVKVIPGYDALLAPRTMADKVKGIDDRGTPLTLLAMTNEGYRNLMQIVTKSHLEGFYYRPRVDKELLKLYAKGGQGDIVCLSGGPKGEVCQVQKHSGRDKSVLLVEEYKAIFGKDNYYIELRAGASSEPFDDLVALAKETNTPLVATNQVRKVEEGDQGALDALGCIHAGKKLDEWQGEWR